jgi:hypothetical protein
VYLEGEGVRRERERIALGLGEAAEEGELRVQRHQIVRVRVHRRHALHGAAQRRVPRLHLRPGRRRRSLLCKYARCEPRISVSAPSFDRAGALFVCFGNQRHGEHTFILGR